MAKPAGQKKTEKPLLYRGSVFFCTEVLTGHFGFFVISALPALFPKLLILKLALHLFLVFGGVIVGVLANGAF